MNDRFDEKQFQSLNFDVAKRKSWEKSRYPYSALIELTSKCNMNCVHCYLQQHHSEKEMSFEEVITILDILYSKGILFLTLTGGEIFTRKDFLDIYMYAKRKGFIVELFSNGELITDEMINVFRKYPPVMIDISIYGACEDTYKKVTGRSNAFQKVIENCKKLISAGVRVSLRTPVLTLTLNEIDDMRRLADDMGIIFCTSYEIAATIDRDDISQKYQLGNAEILSYEVIDYFNNENKTIYPPQKKGDGSPISVFSCKMGKGSLTVDYKGNMFPCMKFRHIGKKLTENNFDYLWNSYGKYHSLYTKPDNKCNSCDANYYCEVCPAEMDFLYGDMEYRTKTACKIAKFRKSLYEGEFLSCDEALNKLTALDL